MTATEAPSPLVPHGETADKGLKTGALGLLSSIVIGIASTAPAYSLAATLGFVVVVVGLQSPAIMLVSFVPILFIAVAYRELNRAEPDCGTTFTWGTKAFGPRTGWLGGWAIVAADVIVMANLAQIAGQYTFLLFGADGLAASTWWTLVVGVVWIALMTWICYIGIEVSARVQRALLSVELVMLAIFSVVALVKVYSGHGATGSIHPALSWFNPLHIGSFSALSSGVLLAIFIYWGWDTAVAVNEETAQRRRTPGSAAVLSTLVLLATYLLVTVAAQAYAGIGTKGIGLGNTTNSGDVLSVLGDAVLGGPLAKLLILSVLTSAAASTQTTILPTARTTLAMAAYRALPRVFARMHPRYLTPSVATVAMGAASIAFYVGLTALSGNVLSDSISSLGLMIAFYYGMTGFASAWYFRRVLTRSARDLWLKGIIPFLGGLILLAAFLKSAKDMYAADYGATSFAGVGGVFLIGIGSLVLGVVLMVAYQVVAPAFFRGEVMRPEPELAGLIREDTPIAPPRQASVEESARRQKPREPA